MMDNKTREESQLAVHINGIQMLYEQGLDNEALKMEKMVLNRHPQLRNRLISGATEKELRKFITVDDDMNKLKDEVRTLSLTSINDSVLITGESGTGKEIIAKALHGARQGNFVAINCTSLPDYLLESELFGHRRGAFTGAVEDKAGLFHHANHGTIFLDEIGDMPPNLQAKLLRTLQEQKIRRVGDNNDIDIKIRVVCATNRNLEECGFRNDLFQRISTFTLYLKPLRNRINDVDPIIRSLLQSKDPKPLIEHCLNKDSLKGNVRTLQKLARRYEVLNKIG